MQVPPDDMCNEWNEDEETEYWDTEDDDVSKDWKEEDRVLGHHRRERN